MRAIMIVLFVFYSSNMFGQNITKPYYFSFSLASEPYDDRIYGFNNNHINTIRQKNIENPPKPTRSLNMEIGYNFFANSKLQLEVGLGIAKEWNYYHRSYNQCEFLPCDQDLRYLDSYHYNLASINVNTRYQVISRNNWKALLGCSLLPSTRFISKYQDPSRGEQISKKNDFFSLEINPNLSLMYRQYEVGFFYRLWQIKKVDRAIHSNFSGSGHTVLAEDFEKRNPTKVGVTVKYRFKIKKGKEE